MTLCAATSVNVAATVRALQECLDRIEFGRCLLFTDARAATDDRRIEIVPIPRINSSHGYSEFMLEQLVSSIDTSHCLVVQWDGFVINAECWTRAFLDYDYVGAPWPQFGDGHDVGNGGFSLRSRKLLQACLDPAFRIVHPEDLAICRINRALLEQEHGIRFADRGTAEHFAYERALPARPTFGFHGIFNMIPLLGADRFWELYQTLDDRSTASLDHRLLMGQLGRGRHASRRRVRLTRDRIACAVQQLRGKLRRLAGPQVH